MDMQPTPRQQELIDRARDLAMACLAPRAAEYDRTARFPIEDFDDLRDAGFLGLCLPEAYGGLGADLETYCLVSEQLAQGNASTALAYNMHCFTMLMMGEMADAHEMDEATCARHAELRARNFREVVDQGVYYGQPHSEPVEEGETDTAFTVGGRRFGTTADKVAGGYRVNGRKIFVSLSDSADYFATPAILNADGGFVERTLYLKVPPGAFGGLYLTNAHGPLLFSATFLGLMQRAYADTLDYLTGGMPGAPAKDIVGPVMGKSIADMLVTLETTRALYLRSVSEARLPPSHEIRQRARTAHIAVQRAVVEVAQEAIRVCGGRALLKEFPLERHLRDAQAASVMRPWTLEIATEATWNSALRQARRRNDASD